VLDNDVIAKRSLEIDPVNIFTLTPANIMSDYTELTTKTGGKSFSTASELAASTNFILSRPDTKLALEHYYGTPGDEFYFDASATTSSSPIVQYDWDLDFDGLFETQTTEPFVTKTYSSVTSGTIQVKATDESGLFSTMSATVTVTTPTITTPPTISNLSYVQNEDNSVTVTLETDADRLLVSANNFLLGSTSKAKITITDLDRSVGNALSFTPFNSSGDAGEAATLSLPPLSTETPDNTDNNSQAQTEDPDSTPTISTSQPDLNSKNSFLTDFALVEQPKRIKIPKAPNSGVK